MPPASEPHWKLNVGKIIVVVTFALSAGAFVWGKADKSETEVIRERMWSKANQSDVDDLNKRHWLSEIESARASERYKAIENQLATANKRLEFLIENLVTGKKGGEASANQGSRTRLPGESGPGERSSPNTSPVGPNPLSDQ